MATPLQTLQQQQGAVFAAEADDRAVPLTYGNDAAAYTAAQSGVALVDRSHWGRLRVGDADCQRFLHNQTTNQIQQRSPGDCCDTVFVTSTGRTVDLATAYIDPASVALLVSPAQAQPLMDWMDRYIFFADKVTLADETATHATFSLIGPESGALLTTLGLKPPSPDHHLPASLGEVSLRLAAGSGLSSPGYTLTVDRANAVDLWQHLVTAGAVPLGETLWEQLRIEQGRPRPGHELTEDYNPLEAGLWHTLSFDKGCYIGQETIARLNTYQGVKQQLWGLELAAPVAVGTPVMVGESKVGKVTSAIASPARALAYIRTKAGGAGLQVQVGETSGTVVEIPFASRGYLANAPA
jgi:folate-binding protein YgfZ